MPLDISSVHPFEGEAVFPFASRRSVVHSTKGIVACTQPLAAQCGLKILQAGGNAADAAVAVAAGLNMTEPSSTGIGGDMFLLYYDAASGKISALNGSGRSGKEYTLEKLRKDLNLPDGAPGEIPMKSPLAVTVPGAAAGWVDTVERFGSGRVSLEEILKPAIELGEEGFPVSELTSIFWIKAEKMLREASPNFAEMLKKDPNSPNGVRAPHAGEVMKNPALAQTFRTLAAEGKKGFYTGRIAEAIVQVVADRGGCLTLDDLQHHLETGSQSVDPISLRFGGQGLDAADAAVNLWEHPPNGQGIVALMALGILQELEKQGKIPTWTPADHNTAPYLHAIIEALRLAFADGTWFVTDPDVERVPVSELISPAYLAQRAALFHPTRALSAAETHAGAPFASPALRSSDTVYFSVTDAAGNAASFINSNYAGFGTCIIPRGCGFTLQNRGANFALRADHPNCVAPRKRPYHTIIPGLVTSAKDGALHSVFGVMGGFMQPQGHVQVLLGQIVGRLNPQAALDAPRVCVSAGIPDNKGQVDWKVNVEEGIAQETIEELKKLGHGVAVTTGIKREMFGRGQIIRCSVDSVDKTRIWSAGSDPRGDGAAYPAF
ncbi:hypothetical protein TD95_004054 [Thielaviopsis punctulata]|uniref:Gamma-glutamyltransferase n=1 Tax=Thielaviopsis punctulata TaxID=72032 RepID=A0A0F4Z8Z0_9PEZI|nr:hypothetical protein TD95_004054 [Thielaviopsis punctulata]